MPQKNRSGASRFIEWDRRIGLGVVVAIASLLAYLLFQLTGGDDPEPSRVARAASPSRQSLQVIRAQGTFATSGSNPLPSRGTPHGGGITHADYPNGYHVGGESRPAFNSYVDNESGVPYDERRFLGGCVVHGGGCRSSGNHPLEVSAGDRVLVSAYVNNDAGEGLNNGGGGPSVARDSRVYFAFPTGERASALSISAYVRADNAVVDRNRPRLHTISDNLTLRSRNGTPISLDFVDGSGRFLQARPAVAAATGASGGSRNRARSDRYQAWLLTHDQEYWLFTGDRRRVQGNTEEDPSLGLPIGSDGSGDPEAAVGVRQGDQLRFLGGSIYRGFVQFLTVVNEDGA